MDKAFSVRAVHCDHSSDDEAVFQALERVTDPLARSWAKLEKARRIGIKFNHHWSAGRVVIHEGHRQQLVSDPVARATLRLLRERTKAEIYVVDVGVERAREGETQESLIQLAPVLREFDVPFINGHDDTIVWVDVPGGGRMLRKYPAPKSMIDADAVVSVQKLKNHLFAGVTLCLKNLFGLAPIPPHGRPRAYYHHLVRMPYVFADLGRIYSPALNILDGLVCQAGEEWGKGENPRICNTLIAGDQVIATDACGAHLMGHDPQADWLTPPFHRDRNTLLVAAQGGFGTVNLDEIDFQSEVSAPVGEFFAKTIDSQETIVSWRRTMCEQALYYRDHRKEFESKYAGQYILLQMGEVRWASPAGDITTSRRELAGDFPEQAMWLKYVDPDECEGEHFEVYEEVLRQMQEMGV